MKSIGCASGAAVVAKPISLVANLTPPSDFKSSAVDHDPCSALVDMETASITISDRVVAVEAVVKDHTDPLAVPEVLCVLTCQKYVVMGSNAGRYNWIGRLTAISGGGFVVPKLTSENVRGVF